MTMPTSTAKAHTNIALVKYWGKKDADLIIPQTNSLSITLDAYYTVTSVTFDSHLNEDTVIFDNAQATQKDRSKISQFLDVVRQRANLNSYAAVITENHVPVAAGLASSASGFAALALAASKAAGLELSNRELSRLARRGSGSATRSIFGGFAAWQKGTDDVTSYAYPIDEAPTWDLGIMAVVLNHHKKNISSREGMQRSVESSPFYPAWKQANEADFTQIQTAIKNHDIDQLGQITENNALRMHALTLSAVPGFTYFSGDTLTAIDLVKTLRATNNGHFYFTIDAGPNLKIIGPKDELATILRPAMQAQFGADNVLITKPGPGVKLLNEHLTARKDLMM